ncbi:DNA ligase 1 isoform X1 [Apis mellifera]|uniref:DNA ligase 1 isoform X1 n=1 Tax=Apis mellifera TaxID=7460 RepID=A0A7M7LSK4_APIME|nr:DNA ligase 1 isoform X1 [Apis mellifera]|eukprot:XP_006568298.3 DNA ligase 1 isoform X1 [Apis mellifera]
MNVIAAILLVTSVPWVIAYPWPGINEKSEEVKMVEQREPSGLFESVTAWGNKIFPFQFLNGDEKVEDSKRLDAQKEYNGERIATFPLEKIFGKDNIFASMISNVIGTVGKAIEGIASNVQKGIGLPFFPNREMPTVDADKSDSGHSKRYGSREEASVKEGGRRVGYRESTEGAKEVDGEKRAIHSAAPPPPLDDGDDAKTGGGERKRWDGAAVSTELGGGSGDAKSWSHSSQGIEKNSLTRPKEGSSRGSTNVDDRSSGKGGGEVKEEVKEEAKKVESDAKGKRDEVEREGKGGEDKVGEEKEKEIEVKETKEKKEEKKEIKEEEEKEKDGLEKKKD